MEQKQKNLRPADQPAELPAVEPEIEGDRYTYYYYVCGECHGPVDWKEQVCRHCGRRIDWNG